ncbi:uncharacterized protein LOC129739719 isoform X2 [Uranotaenia lowii]|uniref:uncharacterized protein LOC129739719 isoform X2 n=1 Tax=Uranotaenia lowii TaxID=190385 RepID=UPI00247AB363|nr:uncharacterized protein LOC129739719 isoform X2 [Uranotaenia lowii]
MNWLLGIAAFAVCIFLGTPVNAELMPESVPHSQTVTLNPLMPNDEQSVRDCPFTFYPYAKQGLASSIAGEVYKDRTFSHVVRLFNNGDAEPSDSETCIGVIVDEFHILTTKQCSSKSPTEVGFFANSSFPRGQIESSMVHPSLNLALLRLKAKLIITSLITPACFWTLSIDTGFPTVQHISWDNRNSSLTRDILKCPLAERSECFTRKIASTNNGFLQIQAISNYRQHPFVVLFGYGNDGSILKVSDYVGWIEEKTGYKMNAIDCALRYYKFRDYEERTVTSSSDTFQSIQLQNAYVSDSRTDRYKVSIGYYVEDPVKESVITYHCYGTLIHRQYVLTAASCLAPLKNVSLTVRMNQKWSFVPNSIEGSDTLVVEQEQYLEEAYVTQIYIHPEYSNVSNENDVALLLLDPNEFKFGEYFKPACLWTQDQIKINRFQTNGHGPKAAIEYFEERVENLLKDTRQAELYLNTRIVENCPLNHAAREICVGDDAVVVPGSCLSNHGSAMSRELWVFDSYIYDYVFGVNSRGENCGFNTPNVYTKVEPYINWIDSIVFNENVKYNDTDVYYGDECTTGQVPVGICLPLSECPGIKQEVSSGKITDLSTVTCAFEGDESLVCCSQQNSMPNDEERQSEDLKSRIQEIENCPEMYSEFRKNKSPYSLRKGRMTSAGMIASESLNSTCDATLIARDFLLTSASCYERLSKAQDLKAFVGPNGTYQQRFPIAKVITHPKYRQASYTNNVALVKLLEPIIVTGEIIPACLWQNHSHVPFLLELVRFEDDSKENQTFSRIPTYPLYQKHCEQDHRVNVTSSELCVVYDQSQGRDDSKSMICHDTGSGLYNYYAYGLYETEVTYLVGIYSHSNGCEKQNIGIFTRISQSISWIKYSIYRN